MNAAGNQNGFKSFDSLMKMKALQFAEKMIRKRYPELAEKQFEIRQLAVPCPECKRGEYIRRFNRRSCNMISEYQIQIKGKKEWRSVPMPTIVCSECTDNQLGIEAWEQHQRKEIRRKTSHLWRVNEELTAANLSTYEADDMGTIKALAATKKFLEDFKNEDRYSLILRGSYGAGKSHLLKSAAEIIRDDIKKENGDPYTVGFIAMEEVLTMIKNTWDDKTGDHTEQSIIRDLIDLDFLVLDDVGSEGGEFAGKKLFEIINGRMGKPTGITTNFDDWTEFAERFGANGGKITSRIRSRAKVIDIETTDKRITEL